jgi:hypothetical protein
MHNRLFRRELSLKEVMNAPLHDCKAFESRPKSWEDQFSKQPKQSFVQSSRLEAMSYSCRTTAEAGYMMGLHFGDWSTLVSSHNWKGSAELRIRKHLGSWSCQSERGH